MQKRSVGIFLFNEVEVLDFAGPFEVFSIAGHSTKPFIVHTVSEKGEIISARNGLKVQPAYSFSNHPPFDILIIPGGYGAEEIEIHNEQVIQWIKQQKTSVEILASVCTGAFLLAKAGLLDGKKVTTHWMDMDTLAKKYPKVNLVRGKKFIDESDIITSGGISAGINMSFHIVKRLYGEELANTTARRMEYDINIE